MNHTEPDDKFLLTPQQRREALKRLVESENPIDKIILEAIDKILKLPFPDEDDEQ